MKTKEVYVKQNNCSLILHIALYFNFYYLVFWIIIHNIALFQKYEGFFGLDLFLQLTTLTIISLIEFPRIYLGYLGNLKSQLLCCVGFWLLTLLIQLPILTFLLFSSLIEFSLFEKIIHCILYFFHLIELVFGFILVKKLIIKAI